jgi:hypothetical protein
MQRRIRAGLPVFPLTGFLPGLVELFFFKYILRSLCDSIDQPFFKSCGFLGSKKIPVKVFLPVHAL